MPALRGGRGGGVVLAAVVLFLLGAASGVAAVAVHRLGPDGAGWWLASATAVAGSLASPPGVRRFAFDSGWVLVLALLVTGRPEGDYAVAGDLRGYSLMALGVLLLAHGAFTTPRPGRNPAPGPAENLG